MAGVLAHEISHVALRHGTAQASAAQPYAIGQIASAILGAIIDSGWKITGSWPASINETTV